MHEQNLLRERGHKLVVGALLGDLLGALVASLGTEEEESIKRQSKDNPKTIKRPKDK